MPAGWKLRETWLSGREPGPATDEIIHDLADEAVLIDAGREATPTLIRALGLAQGESACRAAALALAVTTTPGGDRAAVDALLHAYHAAAGHASLGPALLEALSLLASTEELARAITLAELLRLDRMTGRYLLVKAAKIAGRLDAVRPEPSLRQQLHEWAQSEDAAVQGEARQQIALVLLADALLAGDRTSLRESLAEARAAFLRAEDSEEHRPDATLFRYLLDAVLALMDIGVEPSGAAGRVAAASSSVRGLLTNLTRHDWHGYRTPRADVVAARVLATTTALERASSSAEGAARTWVRLDEVMQELAALYVSVRGDVVAFANDRLATAVGEIADVALVPALGPAIRQYVGRDRLNVILENYVGTHGEDDQVSRGLVVLAREVGEEAVGPVSADEARHLAQLAERVGLTPDALLRSQREAIDRGELPAWAERLGLSTPRLPIDLPGLYGADAAVDEALRRILSDLRSRLDSTCSRHTWEQLVVAVETIMQFGRHTRNELPMYMRCAEDGGKGRTATEEDLKNDLFRWLDQRFGLGAAYEETRTGGGRSDTGLRLDGCAFPIEVKHEYEDVSRAHVRDHYLA